MAALSIGAVLALAATCQAVVAPSTIAGIAKRESGLDPALVHVNRDGSRDLGLMQINSRNVVWLGLKNPLDPCASIAAAGRLLASLSRYNSGSPTAGLGYAQAVVASVASVSPALRPVPPPPVVFTPGWRDPRSPAPAWDVWGSPAARRQPDAAGANSKGN